MLHYDFPHGRQGPRHPAPGAPYKGTSRTAWNGLVRAIVQATGDAGSITLTASAPGLASASVTVKAQAPREPVPVVRALL